MSQAGHLHGAPARPDDKRDERRRYLKSGTLALGFALAQHLVAYLARSEALHADAWHLLADGVQSFLAFAIVSGALHLERLEHRFREYGGYVQAAAMFAAAAAMFFQVESFGFRGNESYLTIIAVAIAATYVGWRRFKFLHAGSPALVLAQIARAVRKRGKLNATYVAETLHILTDMGMSLLAGLAGLAGILGIADADTWMTWAIISWLTACAVIIAVFAGRHSHDHGGHSH